MPAPRPGPLPPDEALPILPFRPPGSTPIVGVICESAWVRLFNRETSFSPLLSRYGRAASVFRVFSAYAFQNRPMLINRILQTHIGIDAPLKPLQTLACQAASVRLVFNFADPARCVSQFKGTPCGLEGDESPISPLRGLLTAMAATVFLCQPARNRAITQQRFFSAISWLCPNCACL